MWWPSYCWLDYPAQHVSASLYWYYQLQLAFYWSLTFTALFDVARKVWCGALLLPSLLLPGSPPLL